MTSTGEFQINNLPLIIISIAIVALGVLGFLEFKKLYVKLNMISTKIDEINDNFNQEPKEIIISQDPRPDIQKQMMMRRQEEMKKMQMQQQQMQQQQQQQMQQQMQQQSVNPHLQSEYKVHPKSSEEIVNDEKQSINNDTDDTDDKGESIISDSQSSIKIDIENDIDDIDDIDDNDDDDNQSIMTIELDNKFKHLSIKALKDLCKENDLPISGNKTTLVSRLLENDQGNDLEN